MSAQAKNTDVVIEPAVPTDAVELRRIQRETWYATYPNKKRGVTRAGLVRRQEGANGEKNQEKIKFWTKQIADSGDTHAVFMARIGHKTVGHAAPAFMEGQWRIGAIYVLPEAQSKGVGSLLLGAALDWHGDKHDIYLHVAGYNYNAITFYEKFGFELTGKKFEDDAPAEANIPELEMVRKARSK